MYAMKSNSTAFIRNAVSVVAASLQIRMISFIYDVCGVNRETYDPGPQGGFYLAHFGRKVLKLSGSWTPVELRSWMCLGGRIVTAPSHRRPMLRCAVMNSGVFFCTWSGYNVAFSILGSSVQPSTVSVRVFCESTTCRARGNDLSAMSQWEISSQCKLVQYN